MATIPASLLSLKKIQLCIYFSFFMLLFVCVLLCFDFLHFRCSVWMYLFAFHWISVFPLPGGGNVTGYVVLGLSWKKWKLVPFLIITNMPCLWSQRPVHCGVLDLSPFIVYYTGWRINSYLNLEKLHFWNTADEAWSCVDDRSKPWHRGNAPNESTGNCCLLFIKHL